ncbi:MAG TPA: SBBP repeat-containing protein [Chryseosolibacter sp.]
MKPLLPVFFIIILLSSCSDDPAQPTSAVETFAECPGRQMVFLNDGLYVVEDFTYNILLFDQNGSRTLFAGSQPGYQDGDRSTAKFETAYGITADASGNLYITEPNRQRIRKISTSGVVSTIAATTNGFADGPIAQAKFTYPYGIAVDANGNIFVADYANEKIRKISTDGIVSTFAGSTKGYKDGAGTSAQFSSPQGLAIDNGGNLYVADKYNYAIRKITPDGVVTTLAGGTKGSNDGNGTSASFSEPVDLAIDGDGNVFVADNASHRIRKISRDGNVTTIAGSSYGDVDGSLGEAKFNQPVGVELDGKGNLFVTDFKNGKIRKIRLP